MTDKTPALEGVLVSGPCGVFWKCTNGSPRSLTDDDVAKINAALQPVSDPCASPMSDKTDCHSKTTENEPQPVSAEPVIWRSRIKGFSKGWVYEDMKPDFEPYNDALIVQPLYTSPPDQSARIRELEAALESAKLDKMAMNHANDVAQASFDKAKTSAVRVAELEAALAKTTQDEDFSNLYDIFGHLWTPGFGDVVLKLHHELTSPSCPTASIETERAPDGFTRVVFRFDADTIGAAISGAVSSARTALIDRTGIPDTVPWSEVGKSDAVTELLRMVDARKAINKESDPS